MKYLSRRQWNNRSSIPVLGTTERERERERHNFYVLYTSARFNPVVPRSCHARGGPKQMGFEEEAAVFPTENVFREGFLVIFCLYVAWDEKSCERIRAGGRRGDGEDDSFLRCMFVVGIRRVIDGRAETKMRALCLATWSNPMFIFVCTNSFLWPLSPRVATYERTSVFRGRGNIHRVGVSLSAGFDSSTLRRNGVESPRQIK